VIVAPAADTVDVLAVFCTEIEATETVAVAGGEATDPPDGAVPDATAVSAIFPLPMSACVATYVAVKVADCPAANDVDVPEHVPAGDANDTQSIADNDDATDGAA
jgi:hypothetical protein